MPGNRDSLKAYDHGSSQALLKVCFSSDRGVIMRGLLSILCVFSFAACSSNGDTTSPLLDAGKLDQRSSQSNDTASDLAVTPDASVAKVDGASANSNGSPDAVLKPKDTGPIPQDSTGPKLDTALTRPDVGGIVGVPTANSWLFVVRSVEELTVGEKALIDHSEKVGSPLVPLAVRSFTNSESEAKASANFAIGRNGVVISNAASGNAVLAAKAFKNMPVAVITLSERSYNNNGDSSWIASASGTSKGAGRQEGTQVTLTDSNADLTAGLSGTITVSSSAMLLGWGTPQSASALVVATLAVPAGAAAIFVFPRGATLDDGSTAPGPRAGFFFDCIAGSNMTADGWKLWDALLAWAAKA
jgi:hypothetical protein